MAREKCRATGAVFIQMYCQIRCWQIGSRLVRPFHHAYASTAEVFVKARVEVFLG